MLLRFSSLIPFFINVTISFDSILRPFVIQVYVIILKIIKVLFTKQSKRGNQDRLWLATVLKDGFFQLYDDRKTEHFIRIKCI